MNVAVVGGGIVGLSAARFLTARGHKTTLFEQHPLFHDLGSSHGRTRIVRKAYQDAFYTDCMRKAYPMWADLEAACGRTLIHEVGLLYIGSEASRSLLSVVAALDAFDVEHRVLRPLEAKRLVPSLRMDPNEIAVFTPEAGWVDAQGAMQYTFDLASSHGLSVRQEEVQDVAELAGDFDSIVVAPGAWIRKFVDVPVRVTLQTFGYADLQVEGPVWIDDSDLTYGFPSDDWGLKIGLHSEGLPFDPAEPLRDPPGPAMDSVRRKGLHRFGTDASVRHWKGCLYTSTANEDFLLGRLGSNGFFASACSGHGFKMGPWFGKLLADFVDGNDKPENYPRFFWGPTPG